MALNGDMQMIGWPVKILLFSQFLFLVQILDKSSYSYLKHSFRNLNIGYKPSQGLLTFRNI